MCVFYLLILVFIELSLVSSCPVFGGFESNDPVFVPTAPGITIAFECLVLPSQPPPIIEWFETENDVTTRLVDAGEGGTPRILEDRRFLHFREISTFPREYHCEVANARIHERVSGTRYLVNGTGLVAGGTHVYKEIGDLTAFVGEENFVFSYVAADGLVDQLCRFFVGNVVSVPASFGIATWPTVALAGDGSNVRTLSCQTPGRMVIGNTGTVTIYGESTSAWFMLACVNHSHSLSSSQSLSPSPPLPPLIVRQ